MSRARTRPNPDDVGEFVAYLTQAARGRGEAKRARELTGRLGFRDRYLRSLAHEANRAGILVCADNAGYYIPADEAEVGETVGRLRSQAFEMLTRAALLERLAGGRFRKPRAPRAPDLFDGIPEGAGVVMGATSGASEPGKE